MAGFLSSRLDHWYNQLEEYLYKSALHKALNVFCYDICRPGLFPNYLISIGMSKATHKHQPAFLFYTYCSCVLIRLIANIHFCKL